MKIWETKSGNRIIQILTGRSNVFLLTNGKNNILIDTAPKFMWNTLVKKLKQFNISQIDYLILTHTHYDHAENSSRIKQKYNAQVIVHKNEAFCLTSGCNAMLDGTNSITRIIVNLFAKRFLSMARYDSCQPDIIVDSVFDLNDIGFDGYIMHTPGHTTGSVSVIIDNEIAVVGDIMFGILRWSVFPPYATDIKQMLNSWERLLATKCSLFIPGHGSANERSLVQKDFNKRR